MRNSCVGYKNVMAFNYNGKDNKSLISSSYFEQIILNYNNIKIIQHFIHTAWIF